MSGCVEMRGGTTGVVVAVICRPSLWCTAVIEARRLVPRRWWTHRPFLPVADRALIRFRTETQYGDPDHIFEARDVVTWLEWCRVENRRVRRQRGAGRNRP